MDSGGKDTGTLLTTVWILETMGCLGSPNSSPHKMFIWVLSPFHCPVLRLCCPSLGRCRSAVAHKPRTSSPLGCKK